MYSLRFSASILLVLALIAIPATAADSQKIAQTIPTAAAVDGKVSSSSAPLRAASVYAYQLADLSLEKVVTNAEGEFTFASLPVGLYKIIAFKPGFTPAVAMPAARNLSWNAGTSFEVNAFSSAIWLVSRVVI